MINEKTLAELRTKDRDAVRRYVADTLQSAPSYSQLSQTDQAQLANNMVKVITVLTHPAGGSDELRRRAEAAGVRPLGEDDETALAAALADPGAQKKKDPFGPAAQTAPDVFKRMVDSVDFVKFVSGLIDGVYNSIVSASIKQMEAYAKMLEAVVKSAEEFAQDNVDPGQARNFLQNKFPNALQMQDGKLQMKDGLDDSQMPNFQAALGTKDPIQLNDDEDSEQRLVVAAQLKMARMRQQQLSSMLLMGINRIVVTEGEIKASVMFDVNATDTAHTGQEFNLDDTQTHYDRHYDESSSFWGTGGDSNEQVNTRVTTAHIHTEGKTDDQIKAHATMSGSVLVRFKSETFPLEKLASTAEMSAAQERSKR
jgi:hypothetical protein